MYEHILFTSYVNVRSDQKAHKIMNRLAEHIERPMHIDNLEQYWKDPNLYSVDFSVLLQQEDAARAVFETLQICSAIALRWVVTTPQPFGSGEWDFHGSAVEANIRIVGLKQISFEIRNSKPAKTDFEGVSDTTLLREPLD